MYNKIMQFANNNNNAYHSALTRPAVWCAAAVFFLVLPCLIYYYCYQNYLQTCLNEAVETRTRGFKRELLYAASRGDNKRFFSNVLSLFRASFHQIQADKKKAKNHIGVLFDNLPKDASVILFNKEGKIDRELSTLSLPGLSLDLAETLVGKLLEVNSLFASPEDDSLAALRQKQLFEEQNSEFLASVSLLTGNDFGLLEPLLQPAVIFGSQNSRSGCYFYWNFFNGASSDAGGFMVFIRHETLSNNFAISAMLRELIQTPDYSPGFFDLSDNFISVSDPQKTSVVKEAMSLYKFNFTDKLTVGDNVILIKPLQDTPSTCAFTLFSIKDLRLSNEGQLKAAAAAAALLLLTVLVLFRRAYKTNKATGFSLVLKISVIFLLCSQLPVAVMSLFAIEYAASQERLLTETSSLRLTEAVKQIDNSALSFYEGQNAFFKSLTKLSEIQSALSDSTPLRAKISELIKERRITSFYLINDEGKIVFEENQEDETNTLISKIGKKMLAAKHGTAPTTEQDRFSDRLISLLSSEINSAHIVPHPASNKKDFVFTSFVNVDNKDLALIITQKKEDVDREYLLSAIIRRQQINNDVGIIALEKENITNTIPKLSNTFKANMLPLISGANQANVLESDLIADENERYLAAIYSCKNIDDFFVGSRMSWRMITEKMRVTWLYVLLALVVGTVIALILLSFLLKELMMPVKILSAAAKTVIDGSLDVNLPVMAKDELGELSETFNIMADRLQNRILELTILYKLTQKASSTHNQREIFIFAADRLKSYLKAENSGSALIEADEAECITLSTCEGKETDSEIKRVVNASFEQYKPIIEFSKELSRHILSIPLYFADKRFGALYIFFAKCTEAEKRAISSDEQSFIETIRHHLSLIVEKQMLFEQAITDDLTKLYVRRFFMANLEREIERSRRYGFDLSLLMIDIDKFKAFNDAYGHQIGDYVLKKTAQIITESLRTTDMAARYGGEEITVILPQTEIREAKIAAERIRANISAAKYQLKDKEAHVTVSIGVSSLNKRPIDIKTLVEESDKAMYNAKNNGRNMVALFSEAV